MDEVSHLTIEFSLSWMELTVHQLGKGNIYGVSSSTGSVEASNPIQNLHEKVTQLLTGVVYNMLWTLKGFTTKRGK